MFLDTISPVVSVGTSAGVDFQGINIENPKSNHFRCIVRCVLCAQVESHPVVFTNQFFNQIKSEVRNGLQSK